MLPPLERFLILSDEAEFENYRLKNENHHDASEEILHLTSCILNGNFFPIHGESYQKVFSSIFASLSSLDGTQNYATIKSLLDECYQNLEKSISEFVEQTPQNSILLLLYGILYLHTSEYLQVESTHNIAKYIQKYAISKLSINGETAFAMTTIPHYLLVAKCFLDNNLINNLESYEWWRVRVNIIHQKLMTFSTETLLNAVTRSFEILDSKFPTENFNVEDDELIARYYVEKGLVDYHFNRQKFAQHSFEKAKLVTGLYLNVTGKLGVKTKYQSFKTSHLVLEAKSRTVDNKTEESRLPEVVQHYEDTHLLEKPSIDLAENEQDLSKSVLRVIDQVIILAKCMDLKNTNPEHGLTKEEMMPYILRVIEHPQNWLVQSTALWLRARLESDKINHLVRSIEQFEKLVSHLKDTEPSVSSRIKYFYCLGYPPIFDLQRELAFIYSKSGLLESSLVIFRKYGMFEEIMKTLISLDQENRAKKVVIEKLLEEPDNPLLWCMLGDLKRSENLRQEYHVEGEEQILSQYPTCVDMYLKAWEVSEKRFARAKRALGYYYTEKQEHEKAIPEFEESLALSALHTNAWFIYGFCCMRCEKWDKAQTAFSRVTQQNPEDAESWSNLANVRLHQGQKKSAFIALKEAARLAYDSWKIWQNFLYVSIEANEFDYAITAVKRLVDIKEDKKLDTDVFFLFLRVLKILLEKSPVPHGEHLKEELLKMFEKITDKISLDPHVWKSYAGYYEILADSIKDELSEEKIKYLEQAVDKRQRLCRSLQMSGWEREKSKFELVAFSVSELVKLQIRVAKWFKEHNQEDKEVQYLSMAEDILKSVTKRSQEIFKNSEEFTELSQLLDQVREALK
ncbi:hypothetical protein C9374_006727 [Naegleria lovaniensis]|uniref:Uncharacterized protein n=1 Tax=Naegleria lovaniensis TaxID=51637 RepID=A0AA88GMM6_NAELO|nr:uncharacterized protein C9374_006727 [Naegleria lovaniensis]KAG2379610.1 hypothetical protein C9374_006727 [Naegleria lovaniensis]